MLVSPHFLFRIERDPEPARSRARARGVAVRAGLARQLLPLELDARRRAAGARRVRPARRPAGARRAGRSDARRPARLRRSPPTSPASGSRRATSTSSSRIPTSSRNGIAELRDAMKTETTMFFEHVLRENRPISDFLNAELHVPQRAARGALRHRRRTGPSSAAWRCTTDRRGGVLSQAGGADRLELSDAHLAGHSRQVRAAEHPGHAARRRRPATSRRSTSPPRAAASVDARAARAASAATRPARPATATWTRWASGSRTTTRSADGATWTASSRWTPAARCPTASRSPRPGRCGRFSSRNCRSSRVP